LFTQRLEKKLLQLFAHPDTLITIFFYFYKFPLRSTLLLHPLPYRFSGVPANDITTNVDVDISGQFRLGCLQFAMITILDYTSVQQKL